MSADLDVRDEPTGLRRDLGRHELVNGFIGFLFSCTGPVAVILAVGQGAGLSAAATSEVHSGAYRSRRRRGVTATARATTASGTFIADRLPVDHRSTTGSGPTRGRPR